MMLLLSAVPPSPRAQTSPKDKRNLIWSSWGPDASKMTLLLSAVRPSPGPNRPKRQKVSLLQVSFVSQILDDPPLPRGPEILVLTPARKRSILYYNIYYKFLLFSKYWATPPSKVSRNVGFDPGPKTVISLLQSLLQVYCFPNIGQPPFRWSRNSGFDPGPETVNILPQSFLKVSFFHKGNLY